MSTCCQYLECRGQGQPAPHISWWTIETVDDDEVLTEVDEDRAETMGLDLVTEGGLWTWTARERFYIGEEERMACVASDRRGGRQVQCMSEHADI